MKRLQISLLILVCLGSALFGCRPVVPRVALPPVAEETLLQQAAASGKAFHSLRGMAAIRADIEGKTTNARQVVLLQKPANLRTEILGLFNQPALRVAVHRNLLTVHVPKDQLFLQGPATAGNMARFTLLPLGVEELVRLALYDVPLIPYVDSLVSIEEDRYVLHLTDARGDAQILTFDRKLRLCGVEYYRQGDLLLRVGYDQFDDQPGAFPRRVSLAMPLQQASLIMDYADLELNQEIPTERFVLEPPAGTEVRWLPDNAG
ncbi:MAG: hypothetical protein R2940_12190 [Syntrophotaleaceae bacterium]